MSLRFTIDAKAETAELFIYDAVGSDFFGDGVTAKAVAEALKEMKSAKSINVRINSPGGDVFDGMAIRNLLAQSGKRVTVDIDGIAASIASVIAMVGSEIRMADGGMLMIHDALSGSVGNADELRKTADILDQISGEIASIYAKRTKADADAMRDLMKAETWMTSAEAMDRKFITGVSESKLMAASIDTSKFKYRNIPKELVTPAVVAEQKPEPSEPVKDNDYYKQLIADAKGK